MNFVIISEFKQILAITVLAYSVFRIFKVSRFGDNPSSLINWSIYVQYLMISFLLVNKGFSLVSMPRDYEDALVGLITGSSLTYLIALKLKQLNLKKLKTLLRIPLIVSLAFLLIEQRSSLILIVLVQIISLILVLLERKRLNVLRFLKMKELSTLSVLFLISIWFPNSALSAFMILVLFYYHNGLIDLLLVRYTLEHERTVES